MEERDAVAGAELEERLLQLQLLGDTFIDERLQRVLPEPLELRELEAPGEPLDAGDAEIVERPRLAVEDVHAGVAEDLPDFRRLSGLVIVVPQDGALLHLDLRELLGE